ncbi:MAG: 1-acyl-sn-glycerol-3-phosphate acyltransferase [Pelagimonas sp.]
MQWLLSLIYVIQVYTAMAVLGITLFPLAVASPKGARFACKCFARWAIWTAGWMLGLKAEVRGPVPQGEVVVAAKHQSFFDILIIFNALPSAKFIMKRELLWTPFVGVYGLRLGCVPVNRGKRGQAVAKMLEDVKKGAALPGQLVIYPQGTRVAPGVDKPYKVGTAAIYGETGQPCVPAATNVGLFWPRTGILRKPGLAVVEFLDPIPPGVERAEFMQTLESRIEERSNALMREGGFDVEDHNTGKAERALR